MTEFNTGLPSVRQIQSLIKGQQTVEIKLMTNDVLVGKIRWQDDHCLCLHSQAEEPTLIWWQAVVYIQPRP
jgi:host factor-I protein